MTFKPLDFGKEGYCRSIDSLGNIIALNIYHSQQGYAEFITAVSFPASERYHQKVVRHYRNHLSKVAGFGAYYEQKIVNSTAALLAHAIPQITPEFANGAKAIMTIVTNQYGCIQHWQFIEILFSDPCYNSISSNICSSIQHYFITTYCNQPLYAYATDADGNYQLYHDANDVPLAFAPEWKFVTSNDATWKATVSFAFSKVNKNECTVCNNSITCIPCTHNLPRPPGPYVTIANIVSNF